MSELHTHYRILLGLNESWKVVSVALDVADKHVLIDVEHVGKKLCCVDCGDCCSRADKAPQRQWRHLDTMQFETIIRARVPRSRCQSCGVKTIQIPWAGKHSRFTLMFEAFAIEVLLASASLASGAALLNLSWDSAHRIMERAVVRGLARRKEDAIEYIGIDEKSFGKGQDYVSLMVDIDQSRVLEVVKDRSKEACDGLFESLTNSQKKSVKAVAVDFWQAFRNSIYQQIPDAEIVHDHFHISQYLVEAVDLVRRGENKEFNKKGDKSLTGTRQMWLYNSDNLKQEKLEHIEQAQRTAIKTGRAWAIKEMFRDFWTYNSSTWAEKFFKKWYAWAIRSRLKPIKKVAVMLKKHLAGLIAYFRHPITNAKAEGFNSKIQSIKAAARGFRSFENYRNRILFYCGKLDLMPNTCH